MPTLRKTNRNGTFSAFNIIHVTAAFVVGMIVIGIIWGVVSATGHVVTMDGNRYQFSYADFAATALTAVTVILAIVGTLVALVALYGISAVQKMINESINSRITEHLSEQAYEGGNLYEAVLDAVEADTDLRDELIRRVHRLYLGSIGINDLGEARVDD